MNSLILRRVGIPDWAPAHARHVVELEGVDPEAARRAFAPYLDGIVQELHRRLEAFVNDSSRCSPGPRLIQPSAEIEPFPLRARLAGTYFIGSETYIDSTDRAGRPSYDLVIVFRLQEHPWAPGQVDIDYLGLEARVYLWLPDRRLEFEAFSTSVI